MTTAAEVTIRILRRAGAATTGTTTAGLNKDTQAHDAVAGVLGATPECCARIVTFGASLPTRPKIERYALKPFRIEARFLQFVYTFGEALAIP
jgi:hypothetical protein